MGDMRAEFQAWVQDCGCDTDGAWSAWQGCWNRRQSAAAPPIVDLSDERILTLAGDHLTYHSMNDDPSKRFYGFLSDHNLTAFARAILAASSDEDRKLMEQARDALQWYGDEADALARNLTAKNISAVTASVQVLGLDGGSRASRTIAALRSRLDGQKKPDNERTE